MDESIIYKNIEHEMQGKVSPERQIEIDKMDKSKRVFTLARSKDPKLKDYRKASDGTVYKWVNGSLQRVTKKETKVEKKTRKKGRKRGAF